MTISFQLSGLKYWYVFFSFLSSWGDFSGRGVIGNQLLGILSDSSGSFDSLTSHGQAVDEVQF